MRNITRVDIAIVVVVMGRFNIVMEQECMVIKVRIVDFFVVMLGQSQKGILQRSNSHRNQLSKGSKRKKRKKN